MQEYGLRRIHNHLKDYVTHTCNSMIWMDYMAMTRDGMNGPRMQLDGLEWLHGHLKDYMARPCNLMDWMDYMAMTRCRWIEWSTNAISWIWYSTLPFVEMYDTSTQLNGLCIGWTTWPWHSLNGLNGNCTQSDGLDKIHGHSKDYMAHQCKWMDWMHYMATTRFGWIDGTPMQVVGFGQDTWPFERLYGSPMQLDGLQDCMAMTRSTWITCHTNAIGWVWLGYMSICRTIFHTHAIK